MFCGKKPKHINQTPPKKSSFLYKKKENLLKKLRNSPKGKGSNKGENIMTSLPQGIFPIYTLVTHTELLTTNQHINLTL